MRYLLLFQFARGLQAGLDQSDIRLRRCDALLRLLLEDVEHVDRLGQLRGVDRSIRAARVVLDHLDEPV